MNAYTCTVYNRHGSSPTNAWTYKISAESEQAAAVEARNEFGRQTRSGESQSANLIVNLTTESGSIWSSGGHKVKVVRS